MANFPTPPEEVLAELEALRTRVKELEQAEMEQQRGKVQADQIVNTTMDGFFVVDVHGRFLEVNDAYADLTGYRREELLKMRVADVEAMETPEEIAKHIQMVRELGLQRFETNHKRKDGSTVSIELSVNHLADSDCIFAFVRDMTDRRRTEESLRESNERLNYLLSSTSVAIYTCKPSGDYGATSITENVEKIAGYKPAEFLEDSSFWVNHVHPDDTQHVLAEVEHGHEKGQHSYEYRFLHKDGKYIWIRDEIRLMRDKAGNPAEFIGYWIDITKRRKAEEERAKLESQLRQAHKMEAVGRLAGGVAHDFNNLLTVVLGCTSSTLRRIEQEDPQDALQHVTAALKEIHQAGNRGAKLAGQLLAFSRRQIAIPRELDINQIIDDIQAMLRGAIHENIELEVIQNHDIDHIRADSAQIEGVILNLVLNANDAMPKGGKVSIETANVERDREAMINGILVKPGAYVMLAVRDTGEGIDKDTLSHIFEPFFTTKAVGKGTGLGLAMVYGIVTQAEGHITVTSEYGTGTTFRLYFPAVKTDPTTADEVGSS